jgi:hypothetical protein
VQLGPKLVLGWTVIRGLVRYNRNADIISYIYPSVLKLATKQKATVKTKWITRVTSSYDVTFHLQKKFTDSTSAHLFVFDGITNVEYAAH